jgi:outer membrane protein assembly factor BamB
MERTVFHVKRVPAVNSRGWRSFLAYLAIGFGLLSAACSSGLGGPDGWSSPVQAGNAVVFQDESGQLVAVAASAGAPVEGAPADGTVLWRFPADGDDDDLDLKAIYAAPLVDGEIVYVASYSGHVVALDAATGTSIEAWGLVDIGDPIVATPVLDGARLLVATESGSLIVLDAATGALIGAAHDELGRIWAAPALGSGHLVVADMEKAIRAIPAGAEPGAAPVWDGSLDGAVAGDLLADGDAVLAGTLGSSLYALDPATGDERWRFEGDGWFWAQPLVDGGLVYAATVEGTTYAIDRAGGDERWSFAGEDSEIRARPALVEGVLVVASRDGWVYGIDPATGSELWTIELEGDRLLGNPLVLESAVLYSTGGGDLIRLRNVAADAPTIDRLYERS